MKLALSTLLVLLIAAGAALGISAATQPAPTAPTWPGYRLATEWVDSEGEVTLIYAPATQPATAPTTAPTTVPATAPAPAATHKLFGVNLEAEIDWGRSRPFVDLVKTCPSFDSVGHPGDGKAPIGPDGWPTSDFYITLARGAPTSAGGNYSLIFNGSAKVNASNGSKVLNLTYDAAANVTTATIQWNAAVNSLGLQFTNTTGPRHLQVLRPGYPAGSAQPFTNEFLGMLRTLNPGAIRGMDPLATNDTAIVNWADRPTPATPSYATTARPNAPGIPYELLIDLVNQLGADLWLNVPVTASEDYRAQLAALVAARLRPDLFVYLEFGNENWNNKLGSHAPNVAAAVAQRATLGFDPQNEIAGWQRTARETARLGQVFSAALGSNRVRPVLCGQGANLATLQAGWQYLQKTNATGSIYGVAIAPYSPLTPDLAPTDWRTQLLAGPHVSAFLNLAKTWKVASCLYESGSDLDGTGISMTTQADPRMETVLMEYYAAWKGTGLVCHYSVCGEPTQAYGLTSDAADLQAPKFKAAVQFSASR